MQKELIIHYNKDNVVLRRLFDKLISIIFYYLLSHRCIYQSFLNEYSITFVLDCADATEDQNCSTRAIGY